MGGRTNAARANSQERKMETDKTDAHDVNPAKRETPSNSSETNPCPYLRHHFDFKCKKANSFIMQCKLCLPKETELASVLREFRETSLTLLHRCKSIMETMLSETPNYRKAALCNKAAESRKNTESPKAIDVISYKYTVTISLIEKEAKTLPAGEEEEEEGGKSQSAISKLNHKKSQSAKLIVFAQEQKQIVSNSKSISDPGFPGDQTQDPTLDQQVFLNVSITKLLYCLSEFLRRHCYQVKCLLLHEPVQWLRAVDNAFMRWEWQEHCFISLSSLVFLYMMCRSVMSTEIDSEYKLRQELYICLYLTYSYMGSEVTYPIRPFLLQQAEDEFWDRCLEIIQCTSADMLKLNTDPQYFTQFFEELLSESQ